MNKRVLHLFSFLFLLSTTAFSQAVTMATATGGLSGAAQISGTNDIAILGVQLTKAGGGGNTVTTITVAMTPTPVGKFTNARLYESADATFSGVGVETPVTTGTISATDISFTGAPLSNFDGATAAADDEYFFIVVDVAPAASGSTTPSLASTGVIVSTGTTTGTTITGSTYTLTPPQTTIANLSTGLAASPLQAGATAQGVFGFSLTSNGTQTLSTLNISTGNSSVGKWSSLSLITSTDNSFATTGDNSAPIGGLTFNATATEIQITGLSQSITTSGTNFFLVADVNAAVNGSTTAVTPSLGSANATATTGTFTGTATGTTYSFAPLLTIANLTTGLASSPLTAGATNQGVFGFSLTSSGSQTVTVLNVHLSSTPASKWTNYRLITSTDANYATPGDNSAAIGGLTFTPSASQVAITGLSQVITSGTNYFLVVDVDPAVTGATPAIQPSLAAADVTITTGGGIANGTATGTSYSFGPLLTIANLSTGLAASPLTAGSTNQGVFGFSLTSGGSQTVTVINIQLSNPPASKWTNYRLVTSTDASYATSGDNSAPIGGLTFTPSANQVAITGLSQVITSGTNYFLVVDVDPSVNGGTMAIQPSLGAANVTITTGGGGATGTATGTSYSFSPLLTIANLSTGLASSPLIAGTSNQGVFGFSLTSSGSQTVSVINVQLSSTPSSKWSNYRLITSTDPSYATAGDNSAPIGGLTFTPSASQVAITGLSQVITSGTNYFLVVDVDPAVTGATTAVQPSLGAANVTVSTGGSTGTASGTSYSFIAATATFAQLNTGIASSPLFAGTTNQAVIGFSASSNGSQTFTVLNIQTSSTSVSKWGSYSLVRSTDNSFTTAGDNTTIGSLTFTPSATQIAITGLNETLNGTTKNYFLVATVDPGVTLTTVAIQPSFTQANVTVTGSVATVGGLPINGINYTFNSSQNSDIILNGSVTTLIPYRTRQFGSIDNTDLGKSTRLASFQLRDGAGTDLDNKTTNLTSLTISVTHPEYIRQISLFDDDTDTEIAGTEQTGTNQTSITFTPSSPVSTASDNGVRNLMVRATFMDVVTDNDQIVITITGATANTSGSGFSPIGGWASTATAPGNNLIDVVATKLVFNPALPTTVLINQNFQVIVKAVDGLNNLDVDQNDQFSLSENGPGTLTSFGGTTLTPFLSAGTFTWNDLRLNLSGSYPFIASDDAYDDDMGGDATGNITINSPACDIDSPPDPVFCFGNPSSATALGNIVITETDPAGISGANGAYTFSLALPAGFVFDQSVTTGVSLSGTDLNTPSGYTYPGANVVQFSFNLAGTADVNSITIGGLKIYAPHPQVDNPTGIISMPITRLGGSASIAGITAGTTLTTISATQQNTAVTFTVDELTGNPEVDPNTTTFNVSSAPVKLISSIPAGSVFTGNGVTSNPEYRFNPSSLSSGTYPVTLIQTAGNGCQSYFIQNFEVIISGIVGLNSSYCSNDLAATGLSVNQSYINQIMQYSVDPTGWLLDGFVYYDHNNPIERWQNITPVNNTFDPRATAYADELAYWGGELPIGFSVYNPTAGVPQGSNYVVTYQWVRVNPAPTVSLILSKTKFCMGDATIDLIGVPANSDNILVDYFRIDGAVDSRLTQVGTSPKIWKFNPGSTGTSGPVGSFDITYSYLDPATSCRGTSTPVTISVNEVVPNITFPNNVCAGDPVVITNASTVRAPMTSIITAGWDFGDQVILPPGTYASSVPVGAAERTAGTYQNPSHLYQNNGTFQIRPVFETSDGCIYQGPSQPVTINALPNANFTWTNACLGSPTAFSASQNLPDAQIQSWNWNFGIGGALTGTGSPVGKTTSFTYSGVGKDTVRLIVITNTLCKDTVYKPVFIVPTYSPISGTGAYSEGFASSGGWISGGRNSSWQLGIPSGSTINPLPLGGNAWDTNPAGQNNAQENSWVMSGCFDFSGSAKPVFSFDTWSDNQYGSDGAVIQYNTTGNIEELVSPANPDGDWVTLGVVGQGINWYDDQGILSNPGNQTSTSAGWTGKDGGWKTSTFKLDPLIGQTKVLFRVAFSSTQPRGDGFAFDNVFVGERSRVVLLENFTNATMTPQSGSHNSTNYESLGTAGEIVKIQYHTGFPTPDPVNELNTQMHNARAAFYGITQAPTIRIDGSFKQTDISNWRDNVYDERVLTPSQIQLSVTATKVDNVVEIKSTIKNTTSQPLSLSGLNLFTTIVEKSINSPELLATSGSTEFVFVAKQMLPSPAGIILDATIDPGGTYVVPTVIWQRRDGDAIVVFVQDISGSDKNVHQAAFLDAAVSPDVVTSTEDPEYVKNIHVYPNPANQLVNIELPAAAAKPTPVVLIDAFGKTVYQSEFRMGEKTKAVSTETMADGVYMLQLTTPGGSKAVRKVMVKH
ncbi:MAG: T9SS type A sorting domain-containing protein [Cyclobacteriaceae bacterium]|nr:T9SS type A sorting domain-containing protein [Cyclobacteriaceae bacterium]